MAQSAQRLYTPADYLAMEETSEQRHEFLDGVIYDMAGASADHNAIALNVAATLRERLRAKPNACRVFMVDMRLLVNANGLYTYPDVMAVCGPLEYAPGRNDTLTNAVLIAEVLSPATAAYDRGEKFILYQQLETLRDYLLIDQHRIRIEYYQRAEGRKWVLESYTQLTDVISLQSLGCEITPAQIYESVIFEAR